jgi:hypothetical protein
MKKNTLKVFAFCAFAFTSMVSAQNTSAVKGFDQSLQLNETSQESLNQTGFVKCVTDEMHKRRLERNPNLQTDAEFEAWLAPLVTAKKVEIAQQKAAGSFQQVVVTMPIVFHVITDGTAPSNISGALVQAQIDQLNLDFSNQAGADGGFWDGRDADAEIVFLPAQVDPSGAPMAEPGINRVTAFGAGPFGTGAFDGVAGSGQIKPETVWDRSKYVNVWVAQISGGILGYAQFPSNSTLPGLDANGGTELNDGVVIGTGTVGSVAMPGTAAPYNMGRTLTHEIGHWIGLRHIWGDTNCSGDDFCNDTPNAAASNFGCPNTTDSCTTDADRDMVENYMDYTDDSCMDIFTTDQVFRIATVIANSDGISDLPNSTTGVAGPIVSFSGSAQSQAEQSDCSFTDVTINMVIGAGASANADATVSVSGGTAADTVDFMLMSSAVSFASGATAPSSSIVLRVYNDSEVEGDETVELTFALNANGGDATIGNNTYIVTITDDDVNPLTGGAPLSLFSDDFESGLGNWTVTGNGTSNFATATNGTYPDAGFFNSDQSNGTTYVFVNDDDCDCDMSQERIAMATSQDLSTYTEAYVTLDYAHDNQYGGGAEYASLEASIDNGTTWTEVEVLAPDTVSDNSLITFQTPIIDVSAYAGQSNVRFSVFYNDGAGWVQGLIFDNFNLYTPGASGVQTAVNAGVTEDQVQLLGSSVANAFDTGSGDMILDINITDTSNYGCTSASVSRAGTSGESFQGSIAPALVTNKTFTITPTTDNVSGTSTLSFYFTEAELAGWEAITGDDRNNLRIGKDNGSTVVDVASTITAFGSNWKVTGDFTNGIGGTYYFGRLAFLSTSKFSFDNFGMYPNPAVNEVTIKFNTTKDVAINLYDINGRLVIDTTFKTESSSFNQNINISNLATGVYVVKIESGDNTMFRKLVVN